MGFLGKDFVANTNECLRTRKGARKMKRKKANRFLFIATLCMTIGLAFFLTAQDAAADVVLNPGYIEGSVSAGNESIYRIYVSASGGGFSTSKSFYSTTDYSLTVNTGATGEVEYTVYCEAYTDDGRDRLVFERQTVTVYASTDPADASTADFHVTPGYISGTVSNTGNATLTSGNIYAYYYDASTGEHTNRRKCSHL